MPIPSHQQWMSDTNLGFGKPRSAPLKALDNAIQQYERAKSQEALFQVKNAFEDWKRSKGANWKASDRNRRGAVTRLDQELGRVADYRTYQLTNNRFTMEELQALAYIARERKKVIANVFAGKEVTFRNSPRKIRQTVQDELQKVKARSEEARAYLQQRGVAGPPTHAQVANQQHRHDLLQQKIEDMVKGIFEVDSLERLGALTAFIMDIVGKCGVSVAPWVGHLKDGYDLFTGWAKAAAALHSRYDISRRQYVIDTGAPQAAFAGLKTCLTDEAKNESAAAGIATTSFALKTGLAFVDGGAISGPVVGAANALAGLSLQLYWLATEWKATQAINEALRQDNLDINLFKTYPLMGCYLLTSATFSDLIPIENFGTPGWMDYVENLKKRNFDGIYDAATGLIDKSPWEIEGLPKRPQGSSGAQLGTMFSNIKGMAGNIKDVFS